MEIQIKRGKQLLVERNQEGQFLTVLGYTLGFIIAAILTVFLVISFIKSIFKLKKYFSWTPQ